MSSTSMASDEILRERRGPVEWIIFNRPQRLNAMTHRMEDRLIDICRDINQDKVVRAVVFTGAAGNKPAFMAGQDVSDLRDVASVDEAMAMELRGEEVCIAVENIRVPTIAAISGACVGAGALLAASCDLRIADPSMRFGFPIARTVGNCLTVKNLARLTMVMGAPATKELIFTARLLNAEEFKAIGALREVTPAAAALLVRAQEIGEKFVELAPLTLWGTKEGMRRLRDAMLPSIADLDIVKACYLSRDYREGTAAFLEKRKPSWTGE